MSSKKIFLILIASCALVFSSCTREFICQCSVKYTSNTPGMPDSTMVEYKIKNTRKEAIKQCKANSITTTKDGVTLVETCQLY